ncbi:GIY-YIG nuclease family protein [Actinomadura xylanilytica]|uniref:GIY-YIG nuclease family protein n=1 Tax=Actinomadura xylanilytica TaxID=887459 RepID=UPI003D811B7E
MPGRTLGKTCAKGVNSPTRPSSQHLRRRIRYHYRGNAYGSTLRLSLGCLLGLELRRVGSGTRLTFAQMGEATLTEWMHEHAQVCWIKHPEP